jgi:hypothetical protein
LAEREADIHEDQGAAAHEEGEDIGRIRLPSELQTKITHRQPGTESASDEHLFMGAFAWHVISH